MILVVFGNVPIPFPRLGEAVAAICQRSSERWVIQRGYTANQFPGAKAYDFLSAGEMNRLLGEADVIVSHGGYGIISEALALHKKIVAVPRLDGEHNHSQRELVEALARDGHILAVYDIVALETKIREANAFVPKLLPRGNAVQLINEFIGPHFPN
jgi:UDP-N-acetylglucosamine transferase subunit ALG13